MTNVVIVGNGPVATLIYAKSDSAALIQNNGPNTVYLGDDQGIRPTDTSAVVPLTGSGYLNVDGTCDIFGICLPGQTQALNVITSGLAFFSPPSLSGLGGVKIFAQTSTPTGTIPVNSLWFNLTDGSMQLWNGSAWIPQQFSGQQIITAGTVYAAQLAAGIVKAGIVDATNVLANSYIATSAAGEFLAYDTNPPSAGHLISAIAGSAGTDGVTNPYPKGLLSQQLTLQNIASSPPAFANSSVFYSSSTGRPSFINNYGVDFVLERSGINNQNFLMGTQTLPQQMSGPLAYIANEGFANSEFGIEIDGTITTPTSGVALVYTFGLYMDGTLVGNSIGLGSVMLPLSVTVGYTLEFRFLLQSAGVSGNFTIVGTGGASRLFVNEGNTNTAAPLNSLATNLTFNTTINHTFTINGNWSSGASSGHSAITYRTKIVRRN